MQQIIELINTLRKNMASMQNNIPMEHSTIEKHIDATLSVITTLKEVTEKQGVKISSLESEIANIKEVMKNGTRH